MQRNDNGRQDRLIRKHQQFEEEVRGKRYELFQELAQADLARPCKDGGLALTDAYTEGIKRIYGDAT